jgi:EmrB/QacA subfamily drug resistance transporter
LTAGVLGNRGWHKRLLLAGLASFAAFSTLSAFCKHPAELIACRAAMGFAAAFIMPATLAIVTRAFPGEARVRAIGIWSAVVGAALAIGPLVAGALLERFWWGSVFLVNVPVVAMAVPTIWSFVPELAEAERRRLDPVGITLAGAGLLGFVYGVIRAGDLGSWAVPEVYLPIAAGLVLLGSFAVLERRASEPALDVRYFADRGFSSSVLALGALFFALFGGTFVMTFYLQSVRGYSALRAGACILPLAGAMIAFAPNAPALVRRFGARSVSTAGMLAVATALAGLASLQRSTGIWFFEVVLFVFGAGMAHVLPPTTARIVATLPEGQAGTSSAVNNTFRQVGGAIGIAVLGSVLASTYRSRVAPEVGALPPSVRAPAESSVTATLQALHAAGHSAQRLVLPVQDAFMRAMHITWLVATGAMLVAAFSMFFMSRPAATSSSHAKG